MSQLGPQAAARPTDAGLIAESLSDATAFAALFDRHFVTIHRYLARRVGQEADDLASETFTVAFSRRHSYDVRHDSALPWLYGIATNLVRARRRGRVRELTLVQRLAVREPESGSLDDEVASAVDARRDVESLRGLIDGLAEDDLATLLLYAWEDLSYAQVAEALAVPVGTVRSRLNRVRRRLREPGSVDAARTGRTPDEQLEGD